MASELPTPDDFGLPVVTPSLHLMNEGCRVMLTDAEEVRVVVKLMELCNVVVGGQLNHIHFIAGSFAPKTRTVGLS
jgi:hypothetical protein